jgi:hypothetical protein
MDSSNVTFTVSPPRAGIQMSSISFQTSAGAASIPVAATVSPMIPGGLTRDGVRDGRDVIRCKRIILGLEPGACIGDVKMDDRIDGRDAIRIKKMILGIR